ncbi:MAG: hypothetical protein IPI64_00010 [Chloracidobacterium sp.]|nr:hypothetical protein [Chloracidobacterium sp.]
MITTVKKRTDTNPSELVTTRFDKRAEGTVKDINKTDKNIIVLIEANRRLEIGDKLTGRHGNKGVVTLILDDEKMPFFFLGKIKQYTEVLLSPMGVVSRMNLGQLLETHYSWLVKYEKIASEIGRPFTKLDFEFLKRELAALEIPEGKATLFVDEKEVGPAVVGFQYFAKLNHLSGDKFHVRTSGSRYSAVTGQPLKGKRLGGGQRIGEMEMWALLAHGANEFIDEATTFKSDDIVARENLRTNLETGTKLPESITSVFPHTLKTFEIFLNGMGIGLKYKDNDDLETRLISNSQKTIFDWLISRRSKRGSVKATLKLKSL